jgi:transaldolase
MKLFVDSAITEEIREIVSLGIIDWITTNPTLIKKSWRNLKDVMLEIRDILPKGDISIEVLATDYDWIIAEAKEYLKWDKDFTIKIPIINEGLKATKELSKQWINVNVTLVFSVLQALAAAKAGARYVSPFIGRTDDLGGDGFQFINDIRTVFDNYDFNTEILVASVRSIWQIKESALIGADVVTCSVSLIQKMLQHPMTMSGLEQFLKDAGSI